VAATQGHCMGCHTRTLCVLPLKQTACLPHRKTVRVPRRNTVRMPHRDTVWLPHRGTVWLPYKDTFVSVSHRTAMLLGRKYTKNQKCHQMGRRGSVWRATGADRLPRASRSHGDTSQAQKRPTKKIVPPFVPPRPPCWGQPLRAGYTG